MKSKTQIKTDALINMLEAENRAESYKCRIEIESPLSRICESADALGPLHIKQKLGPARLKLIGNVYYSRFRPGDRVDIRTQHPHADRSIRQTEGWKVESVSYPSPGSIEVVVAGVKPFESENFNEVFLFRSSSSLFNYVLTKRLNEISSSEKPILGNEIFKLRTQDTKFRVRHERLNDSQKGAVEYLVNNNLSGAVQGPPGTGKTELLQTVITLALNSDMKVCVTSFTNAAVDNLLSRVVASEMDHEWTRVGDRDKVRSDLYKDYLDNPNFVSRSFSEIIEETKLIGSTLHKLAFNKSAPKFDLLVVDEAGQVPIYFWPFIQRLARRVILVGDQFQLPPVLADKHANLPYDNIFSLTVSDETPMLETQYRMRNEIQAWSSEKFYKGKLVAHSSVANQDFFMHNPAFYTDKFVVPKKFDSQFSNNYSKDEANFIADKLELLIRNNTSLSTVGVICPYRAQAGIVNATLQNRFGVEEASKVLVDTVERFQGQEREAIFLSFGGSGADQKQLEFLSDSKRLNVSITRAKSRFFCLFDSKLWEKSHSPHSEDLNEFLRWMTNGKIKIKRAA